MRWWPIGHYLLNSPPPHNLIALFGKRRTPDFFELTCPVCGHHQRESSLVVSTNCRGCRVYLKIDGKTVTAPSAATSSPRYRQSSSIENDPNPANAPMSPAATPQPKQEKPKVEPTQATPTPAAKPVPPIAQPAKSQPVKAPKKEATSQTKAEPKAAKPAEEVVASAEPSPPVREFKKISGKTPDDALAEKSAQAGEQQAKAENAPTTANQAPAGEPTPTNPPGAAYLRNKPVKPKAPPPPEKPHPTAAAEPSSDALAPEASSRYRPPASNTTPDGPSPRPKISPLINREKKRSVICFECDKSHEILADSTSGLCPHCGAYIGLKHYDIRDQVNSRIQTRGDVFVHKKGTITGVTIQCHNLIIEGEIKGGAECSGDFIIRKTGKINGPVTSERVIVERRAIVDFMSTVNAREVIIDGEVTGSVSCKKLVLKKRATLDGDLEVGALSVEEGAKHTGNIRMVQS